jgi:hypothetical protein
MNKAKKSSAGTIFKVIAAVCYLPFAVIGLLLCLISADQIGDAAAFNKTARAVTAVITELDAPKLDPEGEEIEMLSEFTRVSYMVEGVEYSEVLFIPQSEYVGQEVLLYYRADKPEWIRIRRYDYTIYYVLGAGIGFIAIPPLLGFVIYKVVKKKAERLAKDYGGAYEEFTTKMSTLKNEGASSAIEKAYLDYTPPAATETNTDAETKIPVGTIVFCLLLCVIGLTILINHIAFMVGAKSVTGIITEVESSGFGEDETFAATVSYTVGGREYRAVLSERSSSFREGRKIKLYYRPDKPESVRTGSIAWLLGVGMTGLSSIFVIIPLNQQRRKRLQAKLREKGLIVPAEIKDILVNKKILMNKMYPVYLICAIAGTASYGQAVYKSERILKPVHPEHWRQYIGSSVPVYINPDNARQYYVDVSAIL